MAQPHLGEFEEIVLLAVCGLGDAYALSLRQRILDRTGRRSTLGSLYRTLSRLEAKGMVRSYLGNVSHQPGGKRKRLYEIEPAGKAAVSTARAARERLWEDLDLSPSW